MYMEPKPDPSCTFHGIFLLLLLRESVEIFFASFCASAPSSYCQPLTTVQQVTLSWIRQDGRCRAKQRSLIFKVKYQDSHLAGIIHESFVINVINHRSPAVIQCMNFVWLCFTQPYSQLHRKKCRYDCQTVYNLLQSKGYVAELGFTDGAFYWARTKFTLYMNRGCPPTRKGITLHSQGKPLSWNIYCDVPGSPCLSKKGESSMWFVSFLNFVQVSLSEVWKSLENAKISVYVESMHNLIIFF